MITITDTDGNDIVAAPPPPLTLLAQGSLTACRLRFVVTETAVLPVGAIDTTVAWGDGQPDDAVSGTDSVLIDLTRSLAVGTYTVGVYVADRQLPLPSTASVNLTVKVLANPQIAKPDDIVYGPVLPRDAGYPGPQDWLFNTGHDVGVLESSLKMLLTTARGERLMEPEYGTNLRRMLFDPLNDALRSAVREEIARTVAQWEPRVEILFLEVAEEVSDTRKVSLQVGFRSLLNTKNINLSLQFRYD